MKRSIRVVIPFLVVFAGVARADRGSIPFEPDVQIFEPTQRAMIAWNGEEEILLLSTDLRASRPTKVLEVIPLPSEPTVKKGDVEVFRKANDLINRKLRERRALGGGRSKGEADAAAPPAGEVTFFKKIGPHSISVTHVLEGTGFVKWVERYLRKSGVDNPTIPEALKGVVAEYIKEGFTWFVFDVVALETRPRTNDAIQYRFATDRIFYPLKITRTEVGDTVIRLLVLTPRLLRRFPALPASRIRLLHEPVSLTSAELRSLSEDMDDLLGHREHTKLRIWEIRGRLSAFHEDLIAR